MRKTRGSAKQMEQDQADEKETDAVEKGCVKNRY